MRLWRLFQHGAQLPKAESKEPFKFLMSFLQKLSQQVCKIVPGQGQPKHLSGCIQKLVALVHNDAAASGQNRFSLRIPVDHIRQQQVVIANLKQIVLSSRLLEKVLIATLLSITFAMGRNADLTAVKAAQTICMIQIQITG